MIEFVSAPVHVRVPATAANLGPGFDSLGLALGRYDEVYAEVLPAGLAVGIHGEGAGELPRSEEHLVVRAMRATFDRLGGQPGGLRIRCHNGIPHGKGLGSSAAATAAGILAARALVVAGVAMLPDPEVLSLVAEFEGHPDNAAACLLGGLTIAWVEDARVRAVRMQPHVRLRTVVFVPPTALSTRAARGLLPATVPHADAATNAGRAGLLVHALTAEPDLLLPATEDWLHQRYREPAMPETAALIARLRADGVAAVVSGAGPSVLALSVGEPEVAGLAPPGWSIMALPVDLEGAIQTPPAL